MLESDGGIMWLAAYEAEAQLIIDLDDSNAELHAI